MSAWNPFPDLLPQNPPETTPPSASLQGPAVAALPSGHGAGPARRAASLGHVPLKDGQGREVGKEGDHHWSLALAGPASSPRGGPELCKPRSARVRFPIPHSRQTRVLRITIASEYIYLAASRESLALRGCFPGGPPTTPKGRLCLFRDWKPWLTCSP